MKFYYAADWTMKHLNEPNILLSFGTVYHEGKLRKNEISRHCTSLFLDNGAYSMRMDNYPYDVFYEWVYDLMSYKPVEWVATVDHVGDAQKTVEAAVKCLDDCPAIPWVPVVQGSSVQEYIDCCTQYEDRGLIYDDWLAIGGLKGVSFLKRKSIISRIAAEVPYDLHGFGMTLDDLKDATIWNALTAADSASWKRRPQTNEEKYHNLELFKRDLALVQEMHEQQTTLEAFE